MDYDKHLADLRQIYTKSTPKQRIDIARQRIEHTGFGPDLLVAHVSAVEGFARSIILHMKARTKEELLALYNEYKPLGPVPLIKKYLHEKRASNPTDFFSAETWRTFNYAVQYRNLLVHECTFLRQDIFSEMIEACRKVLISLADEESIKIET